MYTFIVTNMTVDIKSVIKFYCGRGNMENFIKENAVLQKIRTYKPPPNVAYMCGFLYLML